MSFDWNTWGPPLVVLLIGLVVGLLVASRIQGEGGGAGQAERKTALKVRKDSVVQALRELESHAERLGEAEYQRQRSLLLEQGVQVLEALEQAPEEPAPAPVQERGRSTAPFWIAGTLGFAALAMFLVKGAEAPRQDDMAGDGLETQISAEIQAAQATLQANPHDVPALNTLAHYAILQGNLQVAMQHFQSVQLVSPREKEVVAHGAALAILVNMADRALPALEQLLTEEPEFAEGHWWMAVGLARSGKPDAAREHLALALKLDPAGEMGVLAADMLQRLDAPPPEIRMAGTVRLAEGATVPEGASLYVAALRSKEGGGPPVAAQRLGVVEYPALFSMGDANLTFGGEWPEEVWLRARLDLDGDPMTRDEVDLTSAVLGPLGPGSEGLELVLGGV
jgi:cytochrome c-type biogenesis protein CcmH/NrfG